MTTKTTKTQKTAAKTKAKTKTKTDDLVVVETSTVVIDAAKAPKAPKAPKAVKEPKAVKAPKSTEPTKQIQLRFWTALVADLKTSAPQIKPHAPRTRPWLSSSIGRANFSLNMITNSRKQRFGVQLWITGADAKTHFADLFAMKGDLESKLGFGLDWQELRTAASIVAWLDGSPLTAEDRWPAYFAWFSVTVERMNEVLRPVVKDLGGVVAKEKAAPVAKKSKAQEKPSASQQIVDQIRAELKATEPTKKAAALPRGPKVEQAKVEPVKVERVSDVITTSEDALDIPDFLKIKTTKTEG